MGDFGFDDMEEIAPEPLDLSTKYWLLAPYYSSDFAEAVVSRFDAQGQAWDSSPFARAVWKTYRMYYGLADSGEDVPIHSLQLAGEDGELIRLDVNHLRNLLRLQIAVITAERIAWDPQARTADSAAMLQVRLARALLDYCVRTLGLERKLVQTLEHAMVMTSCFLALGWDANAGVDGKGQAWTKVLAPYEVAHERVRDYEDVKWWIFKSYESKFEWAAFLKDSDPEMAEKILAGSDSQDHSSAFRSTFGEQTDEDRVPLLYVYAMPTRALPKGRLAVVAAGNVVLRDGPYPYGNDVMIHRLAPAEFAGTSQPCGEVWDLIPIVEAYNGVLSTVMSRVDGFGMPGISSNEGAEVTVDDIGGMSMMTTPMGTTPPQAIDLLRIPPELVQLLGVLQSAGEMLTGVNSVTRGTPAENIKSGSMAALVAHQSMQFNNQLERSYVMLAEAVGTSLVRLYQRMALPGSLISICGQDSIWTTQEFQGEDLSEVLRVSVKTVSALAKTTAGKADIADKLLAAKVIEHPQEYMQVIHTGNVEPLFTGAVNTLNVIKSENERLMRGEQVRAFVFENHELHIREHLQCVDSGTKDREDVMGKLSEHLSEHLEQWGKLSRENPDALAAIGLKPLPLAAAIGQMAMQQQMSGPGGTPPAPSAGPNPVKEPGTEQQKAPPKGVSGGGQQSQQGQQGQSPQGASNEVPGRMPRMPEMPKGG